MRLQTFNQFFDSKKDYAAIFLRLIIGSRLIAGTQDNIFNWERMVEFRNFLESYHFPYPMLSAHASVYAQFACGLCYISGFFVRPAAVIMIINFFIALIMVHTGTTFEESFGALVMFFTGFFFLFNGAGKFSIDERLASERK